MVTGEIETHLADVVVLATGGYGNVFFLSTNAMGCNVTATWRAHRKGAYMANPCYTQIHPTCIPVSGEHQSKLTLMTESLRNDGRIWVPKQPGGLREGPARDPRGGPRLLPGADLPGVRQPGPARHRLPPGEEHVRRGPRRRPRGRRRPARRLPRLRRRDRAAGPRGGRGEVRQPLRHVRPDHRREPLRDADADLPGRALHDGRPVGRLRPAVHDPGPVRHRRGQLLRPRRQPARRLRADAGPGRRLLRAAEHDPRLPRRRARSTTIAEDHPAVVEAQESVEDRIDDLPVDQGHPHASTPSTGARPHHVGVLRHGAHRGRACARRST